MNTPLTTDTILNVNVPDLPLSELRGIQVTSWVRVIYRRANDQSARSTRSQNLLDRPAGPEQDAGPGTDFYAVNCGYVSVTPLHLDLTHYKMLDELSSWVQSVQVGLI